MADLAQLIAQLGQQARAAARILAGTSSTQLDTALNAMADELLAAEVTILQANASDVAAARQAGQTAALIDRLQLNPTRLAACAQGLLSRTHWLRGTQDLSRAPLTPSFPLLLVSLRWALAPALCLVNDVLQSKTEMKISNLENPHNFFL